MGAIFKSIGDSWGVIYNVLLEMQETFPKLMHLVKYMNLETDVLARKAVFESMLRTSLQKQKEISVATNLNCCSPDVIDGLPIELCELPMRWTDSLASVVFPQGGLYCLIGPVGEGKSTLLRFIAGASLPSTSTDATFMPGHLRCLHVSAEPLFFMGSLYKNMTFGVLQGHDDSNIERVHTICNKLMLPDEVVRRIDPKSHDILPWEGIFCNSHRVLLNIARALIANPELLCIHKPALQLSKELSEVVHTCFREFVDKRGIEQDPASFERRRPRTCIVTGRKAHAYAGWFDFVFNVNGAEGVTMVDIPTPTRS